MAESPLVQRANLHSALQALLKPLETRAEQRHAAHAGGKQAAVNQRRTAELPLTLMRLSRRAGTQR